MKKFYTLSLVIAFASPMMAESLQILKCTPDGIPGQSAAEPQLMGLAISADGHYVCGVVEQGIGVFVADAKTGEVKFNLDGDDGGQLRGIDCNGVGIGYIDDDGVLFPFNTAIPSFIVAPEGVRYVQGEDISNDGAVKVGSFTAQSFNTEAACCVGEEGWKSLPVPTDEEKGNLINFMNKMSAAKYVSGDGSVILGHLGSFSFPIVWTRNDAGGYDPDFYPARFIKAVEADRYDESKPLYGLSGMYLSMSNNGRYVGAVGLIANEANTDTRLVPVIYDTKEKNLKIYSKPQDIDEFGVGLYPSAIADDGTFIGTISTPADPAGTLGTFIWRAGEEQAELYVNAFPAYLEMLGEGDRLGQSIPTGISADGKHLLGYVYYSEDYDINSDAPAYFLTYIINTDGTAVEKVDATQTGSNTAIYSIDGMRRSTLRKGLNIVRNADGSVKKLLKQ